MNLFGDPKNKILELSLNDGSDHKKVYALVWFYDDKGQILGLPIVTGKFSYEWLKIPENATGFKSIVTSEKIEGISPQKSLLLINYLDRISMGIIPFIKFVNVTGSEDNKEGSYIYVSIRMENRENLLFVDGIYMKKYVGVQNDSIRRYKSALPVKTGSWCYLGSTNGRRWDSMYFLEGEIKTNDLKARQRIHDSLNTLYSKSQLRKKGEIDPIYITNDFPLKLKDKPNGGGFGVMRSGTTVEFTDLYWIYDEKKKYYYVYVKVKPIEK